VNHVRRAARQGVADAIAEGRAKGLDGIPLQWHVVAAFPAARHAGPAYEAWHAEVLRQLLRSKKLRKKLRRPV
jgi:hypothetical protein